MSNDFATGHAVTDVVRCGYDIALTNVIDTLTVRATAMSCCFAPGRPLRIRERHLRMTNKKRKLRLPRGFDSVDEILGLDAEGCVITRFAAKYQAVLTPCPHASGKGVADSISGVVCRACYRDVHHKHGGIDSEIAIARADLDIVIDGDPSERTKPASG